MKTIVDTVSWALLTLGGMTILMNYVWAFANLRNKRRGIRKHASMVPLAGPLLSVYALYHLSGSTLIALSIFLVDPATWASLGLISSKTNRSHDA
jgi:hypothetical protein